MMTLLFSLFAFPNFPRAFLCARFPGTPRVALDSPPSGTVHGVGRSTQRERNAGLPRADRRASAFRSATAVPTLARANRERCNTGRTSSRGSRPHRFI